MKIYLVLLTASMISAMAARVQAQGNLVVNGGVK